MGKTSLPRQIMEHAKALPEGALLRPNALLHLGSRAAVDQALSRLARDGSLLRVHQGVYAAPVETRFGPCPPSVEKVIASLSELWGETIVPSGGMAANSLRLTTQVPVRLVYLTSGPSRKIEVGGLPARLLHAPRWQLAAPNSLEGAAVRALAFLGFREVEDGLRALKRNLPTAEFAKLVGLRALLPTWIAKPLSSMAPNA